MHKSIVHSWTTTDGSPRLGVLAKRSYRIEPGRRATPLAEVPDIHLEPVLGEENERGEPPLLHDTDLLAFERPLTDVLLRGQAHSTQGNVVELDTGLELGSARKKVRARGARRVLVGSDGRLAASAAEPFASMPLEWTRAYGGRDRHAEERAQRRRHLAPEDALGTIVYPRNRAGRGFYSDVDRDRLSGELLPNLDDPEDPVEPRRLLARGPGDWVDRPTAAGYGPIDWLTFPRCMFHLLRPDWDPPAATIRELALGALGPGDLRDRGFDEAPDPRWANSAPAGLAVCRLQGHERARLWHLHRQHELLELELPGERPRLLLEPPNAGVREMQPLLQTVLIEPDEDRLTLTWTGSILVAAVFPEPMCREMRHAVVWEK
jgi:hypothetical protein